GQLDRVLEREGLFASAPESPGRARSGSGMRAHLLEIDASIRGGRLFMAWSYSQNVHRPETIKQLADSFTARVKDLVSRSKSEPGYEISPADFPLAGISSNELKDLLANVKKGPKHS